LYQLLQVRVYYYEASADLNISAVKVYMDWNINYSSTECSEDEPFVMSQYTYHTFTITFEVPPTAVASNFFSHDFHIYIEAVNATGGVYLYDDEPKNEWFVVYSTVQEQALTLYDEIQNIYAIYGMSPYFSDQAAYDLTGRKHYEIGSDSYTNRDYAAAKTQYELALEAFNNALASESAYDLAWQEYDDSYDKQWDAAYLAQMEAEADYYAAQSQYYAYLGNASVLQAEAAMKSAEADMRMADAAMMNAYGWMLFGFGFIVFGIAACIWAYRRPIHTT